MVRAGVVVAAMENISSSISSSSVSGRPFQRRTPSVESGAAAAAPSGFGDAARPPLPSNNRQAHELQEAPRQELPEAPERTGGRRWDPPPPPRGMPAPGRPVRPLFWRVDQRRAAQSQGGAVSPHIAGASRGGAVSPHTAVEAWPHDAVWSPLGWRRPDPPIGLGTYQ